MRDNMFTVAKGERLSAAFVVVYESKKKKKLGAAAATLRS